MKYIKLFTGTRHLGWILLILCHYNCEVLNCECTPLFGGRHRKESEDSQGPHWQLFLSMVRLISQKKHS